MPPAASWRCTWTAASAAAWTSSARWPSAPAPAWPAAPSSTAWPPAGRRAPQRAVQILVDELRLAMTLLGCPSVRELDAELDRPRRRARDEERMEHVIDPTRMHHAWNRDREPTLRIADGDSVRFALRMAGAEQIREGDSYADTRFDRRPDLLAARPGVRARAHTPATRCAWTSCRCARASGAGAAPSPTSACCPPDFPDPFVKTFDLRGRDTRHRVPAGRDPALPVSGHDGHPSRRAGRPALVPAPSRRREHRHPPPHRGQHAVAAGVVRGRAVLLR